MDDLRIEKQPQAISVVLADGSELSGDVFLRLYEAHHDGHQRVGELLNQEATLLPLRTGEGVWLLNPIQMVTVTIALTSEQNDLMTLGERHAVRIMLAQRREVTGDIYVSLPEGGARVKNFFHRLVQFVPIFQAQSIVYVNQAFILYVRDSLTSR